MKLPIMFDIQCPDTKANVVRMVVDKLSRLPVEDYPYICGQLENDNSKVDLIDVIITNLYSENGGLSLDGIINSVETSLNNE